MRALVVTANAVNRLALVGALPDDWLSTTAPIEGTRRIEHDGIIYLIDTEATPEARLLIIATDRNGFLAELPPSYQMECFQRVLRAALSEFRPGFAKIPLEWRVFHAGSLVSFQTNRAHSRITARVYADLAPEGTRHFYVFRISKDAGEPLNRNFFDIDLFADAALQYESALTSALQVDNSSSAAIGHLTINLDQRFPDANIVLGIPFSTWRDVKLTRRQREFFDTPFDGPLRVKGPAGSGKTLVLTMRFLKEIYAAIDANIPFRACFIAHGEETAEMITRYLIQIDERGVILDSDQYPNIDLEVTTLHGLANRYINRDTDNIQPLSLDGSEGRKLQLELINSIVGEFLRDEWLNYKDDCRVDFVIGIEAASDESAHRAFCYDLSDEFANVVETLGVRNIDEIGHRYLRTRVGERSLAKSNSEKRVVLELYRHFREELSAMAVVSLDQFTADFLAYLNSFRWDTLRRDKGFDCVFADELHLFNAQERRVLGFLLRDPDPPRRVAAAYDPRQSPRNSFFSESTTERDTIWSEAGLDSQSKAFELRDIFRYTPQILAFLDWLNQQFPATDLAEEWALQFGKSQIANGPKPRVQEHTSQRAMAESVAGRAKELSRGRRGDQVAILCLDHDRFAQYRVAGLFDSFVVVGGRDELGLIERFRYRPILSVPEYVAGLQFSSVILIDANAQLVSELGGGPNGLHRFISAVYLGASRAKHLLEIHADQLMGGVAEPIRTAIERHLIEPPKK